jgi:ADP-ribosylglycohydrolase
MARSISETGDFEPERFAYEELPLWLQYERGGGSSLKAAARSLIRRNSDWLSNFYEQKSVNYRNAGGNGAAMRNLPIALVHANDEASLVRDSFFNAVITHGHPRAILGTLLFGLAVQHILNDETGEPRSTLLDHLTDIIPSISRHLSNDPRVADWMASWNEGAKPREDFKVVFGLAKKEALSYLAAIPTYLRERPESYYHFIGALSPATKGSGLATVCAALYLYLAGQEPDRAMYTAVNLLGSDTDTIAVFLGALLGAEHGIEIVPEHLEGVQDREYLLRTARRLFDIARNVESDSTIYWEDLTDDDSPTREDTYLRMLTWEIGFHEMFWDDLLEGDTISHPTLGRGTIAAKNTQAIPNKEEYEAKLIFVAFESGQSCAFHSRVKNNSEVLESFQRELRKALDRENPIRMVTYRVVPRDSRGWSVEVSGARDTSSTHSNKEEAVRWAKKAAKSQKLAEVLIYKKDGSLQDKLIHGQPARSLFDI